jgi:CRP-like cAMP-binding protein
MARLIPIEATPGRRTDNTGDATSWAKVLADIPLFAGLGRRSLRQVAGTGRIVRFHNATAIVRSGEPGDAFYVVIDGEVAVRRRGLPALSLGMGDYFGEMALLDGGARSATVTADGPVTCLTITRPRFLKLLRSEPAIAIAMLEELARRLRTIQSSI